MPRGEVTPGSVLFGQLGALEGTSRPDALAFLDCARVQPDSRKEPRWPRLGSCSGSAYFSSGVCAKAPGGRGRAVGGP